MYELSFLGYSHLKIRAKEVSPKCSCQNVINVYLIIASKTDKIPHGYASAASLVFANILYLMEVTFLHQNIDVFWKSMKSKV